MAFSERAPAGSPARRARAERVLDATAALLRAHGYRRVSIEDVANEAGIGKGTIYLHWKTREALFWAVLQRDTARLLEELVGQLAADPALALPHRLMRAIYESVEDSPLVKAVLLSDTEVLGTLARDESVAAAQQELAGNPDYLQLLADHGVLRQGLTVTGAGHILGSVMRGFFEVEDPLPLAERAGLLAYVLRRALETDAPPAEGVTALGEQVAGLFRAIITVQRAQLERAY
jgi:AcrR family transcriptional regulator